MLEYLDQVQAMSNEFVTLLAEALGLPSNGLSAFYDTPEAMQHRAKVSILLRALIIRFNLLFRLLNTQLSMKLRRIKESVLITTQDS